MGSKTKYWLSGGIVLALIGFIPGLPCQLGNVEAWKTNLEISPHTTLASKQIEAPQNQLSTMAKQPVYTAPVLTSISNNFGKPYDTIVIRGSGFGDSVKKVEVLLTEQSPSGKQTAEAFVLSCQPEQIIIRLPQLEPGQYQLLVQTKTGSSEQFAFNIVSNPQIDTTNTQMTIPGAELQISGSGYGFPGLKVQMVNGGTSWDLKISKVEATKVTVLIPTEAVPGKYLLRLTTNAGISEDKVITIGVKPEVINLLPQSNLPEKNFYIYGKNLTLGGIPTVKFNTIEAKVIFHSATKVLVKVPKVPGGTYEVTINNGYANSKPVIFRVR